jgi:hypothetical protein
MVCGREPNVDASCSEQFSGFDRFQKEIGCCAQTLPRHGQILLRGRRRNPFCGTVKRLNSPKNYEARATNSSNLESRSLRIGESFDFL